MMFCIHCGTELKEGTNFCVNCGASFTADGVATEARAEQTPQTAAQNAADTQAEIARLKILNLKALNEEAEAISKENRMDLFIAAEMSAFVFVLGLVLFRPLLNIFLEIRELGDEDFDYYALLVYVPILFGISALFGFSVGRKHKPLLAVFSIILIVLYLAGFIGVKTATLAVDTILLFAFAFIAGMIFSVFSAYQIYAIRKKLVQHVKIRMLVFMGIWFRTFIKTVFKKR